MPGRQGRADHIELVPVDGAQRCVEAQLALVPRRWSPRGVTAGTDGRVAAGQDVGSRYAAVSRDHNPIHLHRLTARAFEFPKAIAHGMYTKARRLAALDPRLPEAYTVDVRFGRPVLLPATVQASVIATGKGWNITVHNPDGHPHLTGAIIPTSEAMAVSARRPSAG